CFHPRPARRHRPSTPPPVRGFCISGNDVRESLLLHPRNRDKTISPRRGPRPSRRGSLHPAVLGLPQSILPVVQRVPLRVRGSFHGAPCDAPSLMARSCLRILLMHLADDLSHVHVPGAAAIPLDRGDRAARQLLDEPRYETRHYV